MFSGQLVDARSAYQKRQVREQQRPHQMLMFPVKEILQLGERARPWLNNMPAGQLILERVDPRTPEEIERDLIREAQQNTVPMFGNEALPSQYPDGSDDSTLPFLPADVRTIGYRARARYALIPLRRRAG